MNKKSKKSHDTTVFTLSHSSLSTLNKCPREWYYRYIELLYPEVDKDASDFGSLCHEVAENYFGGGKPELKRLVRQFAKKYTITPYYRKKLTTAMLRLEAFYDARISMSSQVYREKEFKLAHDEYIDVVGKVDVLYKNAEGYWVVVDYKTSKRFDDFSTQFNFYYYLISKVTGKTPTKFYYESVYLCAGESNELKDYVKPGILEKDDLPLAENRLENGIYVILKNGPEKERWKKKTSPLCPYCDYYKAKICGGKDNES